MMYIVGKDTKYKILRQQIDQAVLFLETKYMIGSDIIFFVYSKISTNLRFFCYCYEHFNNKLLIDET